jgi:acyl-CoA thioesterase
MSQELAKRIIDEMYNNDPMSKWLGIERLHEAPGECVLRMKVREEMLNGFGIAHGGICFSLADTALAFASNAYGFKAVSLETSISHLKPVRLNDWLTATAKEISLTARTGLYEVRVLNQGDELIAFFKGTIYRSGKVWFEADV